MNTMPDDVARPAARRRAWPGVAVAAVLLAAMGLVWWRFFALNDDQGYRVLFSAGAAQTGRASAGAAARAAGQRLTTGEDGFVTIRLSDGTVVKLMPDTSLDIEDARSNAAGDSFATRLRLISGEIESSVNPGDDARRDLGVFSNSIAIGVRGTVFTLQESGDESRLMVTRGAVTARGDRGEEAHVAAGQGTVARAGEALGAVSRLPDPPAALEAPRITDAGIALAWAAPAEAAAYRVEFAADEAFERLLARHRVPWAQGTLPPLAQDGVYFWRVASIDARGLRGRYSAPSPLAHDYHIERSRAALRRLDSDAALTSLSRSREGLDPEIDALRARGQRSLAAGDVPAARHALATVLALRPRDHEARHALAQAHFVALDYAGAQALFAQVVREGTPRQADAARVGLALIGVRQGRFQDALAQVRAVLERSPRDLRGLNVAAMASVGLGAREQAAGFLRRALEVAPDDPTAAALARTLQPAPVLPGPGS